MSDDSFSSQIAKSSFATTLGAILGVILILAALPGLYFFEDLAIKTKLDLEQSAQSTVTVPADRVDPANEGKTVHVAGQASAALPLTDPDFHISVPALRLMRKVEQASWKEKETKKENKKTKTTEITYSYDLVWSKDKPADSKKFKEKSRENPPDKAPYADATLNAKNVKLGAFTLQDRQVEKLSKFDNLVLTHAIMPNDLKDTAKIDGEGRLYLGEKPDSPRAGDIRIQYLVIKLQPLTIAARQTRDTFEPATGAKGSQIDLVEPGSLSAGELFKAAQGKNELANLALRIVCGLVIALGVFVILRRQVNLATGAPPAGILGNLGIGLIAVLLAAPLAIAVIGIPWLTHDLIKGSALLGGGVVGLVVVAVGTKFARPSLFGAGKTWSKDERESFRAIALDPDNRELRLAFAAKLERKHDPMGEFIRLDQELEDLPKDNEGRKKLDERWNELLMQYGNEWVQPLRRLRLEPKVMDFVAPSIWMHHGILDEVRIDLAGILPEKAEQLFAAVPALRVLVFHNVRVEKGLTGWTDTMYNPNIKAIVKVPQLKQIGVLRMPSIGLTAADLKAIAASPNLINLKELDFSYHKVGAEGGLALAQSTTLTKLRVLELRGCEIGEAGIVALAGSANLDQLTSLNLGANGLTRKGVIALASSAHLKNLTSLALDDNNLGPVGAQAVAASPHLRRLKVLDLGHDGIGTEGAQFLAKSANLANLATLKLRDNKVAGAGLKALAASPHIGKVKVLELDSNEIDDEGVKALAACALIKQLEELLLSYNKIGDAGILALAEWTGLARLTKLTLGENKIGPIGVKALAASPHLRALKELDLSSTQVGIGGARALAASDVLRNLEQLWISEASLTSEGEELLRDRFGDKAHVS